MSSHRVDQRNPSRNRILNVAQRVLDNVIPPDGKSTLKGRTFSDFEDQVEEAGRIFMTTMLEERAALDASAWLEHPGLCPHCESDRVYMEKEITIKEIISCVGPLRVRLQHCRCRACDGSFSPSGERLATSQ